MKHLETHVQQSKDNVDDESAEIDESSGNTTPCQQQNSGSKKSTKSTGGHGKQPSKKKRWSLRKTMKITKPQKKETAAAAQEDLMVSNITPTQRIS